MRRKGQYLNETFLRRKDTEEWALDMERRIDRQEPAVTRKSRDAKLFGDLVSLHRQDMAEVGIRIGRSKDFCLIALDDALGHLKLSELDRERLINSVATGHGGRRPDYAWNGLRVYQDSPVSCSSSAWRPGFDRASRPRTHRAEAAWVDRKGQRTGSTPDAK